MSRIFFALIFFAAQYLNAQIIDSGKGYPVDTSFNVRSTEKQIVKNYPDAVLVNHDLLHGVAQKKNIVYASAGKRELHLDLYMSASPSKKRMPAVLLIHGGGWRSGNREMELPMAQHLAVNGYVTATVEYRLSPEAKYPAAVYDLKAAVRWMRANAAKYNIDSKKIAVYGTSAGGHLAAFMGSTNGMKKFEGMEGNLKYSSSVQAVIDIDGVLDFTDPAESGKDGDPANPSVGKQWLGSSYKENPAIWTEVSPLTHAGSQNPPIIFVNSSLPRFHAGREAFIKRLSKFNIYSEIHTIPDTPHPFWLFHPWFEVAFKYIHSFLDTTFKKSN